MIRANNSRLYHQRQRCQMQYLTSCTVVVNPESRVLHFCYISKRSVVTNMTSNKVRIHSDKTPAVFLPNIEIVQASILSSPNLKRNSSLASSPLPFLPSLLDSIFLSALRYRVSMRKSIAPVP